MKRSSRFSTSFSRASALVALVAFGFFTANVCWCADLDVLAPAPPVVEEIATSSCHQEPAPAPAEVPPPEDGSFSAPCCCDDHQVQITIGAPEGGTGPSTLRLALAALSTAGKSVQLSASTAVLWLDLTVPPPAPPPPFLLPLRI